jgi:hypothetical protein
MYFLHSSCDWHYLPILTQVEQALNFTSTSSIHLHVVALKRRDNFAFQPHSHVCLSVCRKRAISEVPSLRFVDILDGGGVRRRGLNWAWMMTSVCHLSVFAIVLCRVLKRWFGNQSCVLLYRRIAGCLQQVNTRKCKWNTAAEADCVKPCGGLNSTESKSTYFFDPEDGGDMFLRHVGWHSTDYTELYSRR